MHACAYGTGGMLSVCFMSGFIALTLPACKSESPRQVMLQNIGANAPEAQSVRLPVPKSRGSPDILT